VTVSAETRDGVVQFTVEDQGIGIAPQDQARIFGRFERAVSARHYGGLGLGLFIVRQIVEAMGGNIRVQSELGAGAKFIVQLPLEPPREQPADMPALEQGQEVHPTPHAAISEKKLG
jgi:signal transduction histidine kinase